MDQGAEAGGSDMSGVELVIGMGVRSLMGWRRSARALVTESEAPESSMKDSMIRASEGVVIEV
jgi:hypothetical protein